MAEARGTVSGSRNTHELKFYGISTCVWCRRTRKFLEDQDVSFDFTYLDLVEGEELHAAREAVRKWNPKMSFPTVVIDNDACVVGYHPDELREALGL